VMVVLIIITFYLLSAYLPLLIGFEGKWYSFDGWNVLLQLLIYSSKWKHAARCFWHYLLICCTELNRSMDFFRDAHENFTWYIKIQKYIFQFSSS
jgi:hypothetical protein